MNNEAKPLLGAVGRPIIAWVGILLVAAFTIISNQLGSADAGEDTQDLELMLVRMQSQYIVGTAKLTGNKTAVLKQISALNVGSLNRRQRYVALVAELGGPSEAAKATAELDKLLSQEAARGDGGTQFREEERAVQQIFRDLYLRAEQADAAESELDITARISQLSEADRGLLREQLGWVAGAVLAPEGTTDTATREAFLAPTGTVAMTLIGGFLLALLAGFIGLVLLVVTGVMAFKGRLGSGLAPGEGHRGVYAETFAIWLVCFIMLSILGGMITIWFPVLSLWPALITFLASLVTLRWPVLRGIPWESVRRDIGLYLGERPAMELLAGVGGYLAALPLLAMGMLCTLVLISVQTWLAPELGAFEAAPAPSHPIVLKLAESSIWLKIQVLLLASVAAPIVEETMFRGVFYRYLRDGSRKRGIVLSVVLSGGVSSLVFAAVHPQGWVAIPALMSLAFAFVLLREWRGSLVPAMVLHGISNGVVMMGLLTLLSTN